MQRSCRPACRVAGVGLTASTIRIDSNESREPGVVRADARKVRLERITCRNLTPRQGLGKRDSRKLAGIFVKRHGARMHELRGNDDRAGTGLAFFRIAGGAIHG